MNQPSSMPWVKMQTGLLDDPRLGRLTDAQKWRFVQLELLAGKCDAGGYLLQDGVALTIYDLAWCLRLEATTLQADLAALMALGLVACEAEVYHLPGFMDRQGPTQADKRAAWRERQTRHRESDCHASVTHDNNDSHAEVTPTDKSREDKDKEKEKDKDLARADARVTSPSAPKPPPAKKDAETAKGIQAAVVYHDLTRRWPARVAWERLKPIDNGGLTRWGETVKAWLMHGWNPGNIAGMLDCYERGELPGARAAPKAAPPPVQDWGPEDVEAYHKRRDAETAAWEAQHAGAQ